MAISYTIEVGWAKTTAGRFVIGTSTIGGADTLASLFGDYTFTDISADVERVSIRRGRSSSLSTMDAGECTITLHDPDSRYSPENATSPYAGNLVPLRPVRITVTEDATSHPLFRGYIRRLTSDPDWGAQVATIEAVDLFVWLDRVRPVVALGETTTGGAIGAILDAAEWTDASLRDLDVGDTIPGFYADGSATALQLIGALLTAERGVFFINRSGVAVYEDRGARNRAPRTSAQSTLSNTQMRSLALDVDLDRIRNRATVTRTGGTPQTATDVTSFEWYGWSDVQPIETPYLMADSQALGLASWLVLQQKSPIGGARHLDLSTLESGAPLALFSRDLNDRIAVTDSISGLAAGGFHIEQIVQQIELPEGPHTGTWLLSKRPSYHPFIIGVSTLGSSTDVFTF